MTSTKTLPQNDTGSLGFLSATFVSLRPTFVSLSATIVILSATIVILSAAKDLILFKGLSA